MLGEQAIRLIRERWQNINLFAEELYAVFQDKIPYDFKAPLTLTSNVTDTPLTLRQFGNGPVIDFVGKNGFTVAFLDQNGYLRDADGKKKCHCLQNFKKTPVIVWATPANIFVGTALSGTQLNATAEDPVTGDPVPGVFVYTPPSGTVLSQGDAQSLSVLFTPTDLTTYTTATGGVLIDVTGIAQENNNAANSNAVAVTVQTDQYVVFTVFGIDADTATVSDTMGLTWTKVASTTIAAIGGTLGVAIWTAFATSNGSTTITAAGATAVGVTAVAFSGVHLTSPLDGTSTSSGGPGLDPSTTWTTGSTSVSSTDEMFYAVWGSADDNGEANFPASPFTSVLNGGFVDSGNDYGFVTFRRGPVSSAQTATRLHNMTANAVYVSASITFKHM